jgi:hypothetical protein
MHQKHQKDQKYHKHQTCRREERDVMYVRF